ncbi:hypothetical protein PAESOLCIP111_04446 [Paenibacillus solanacearum]|uniref:Uncharacterized protein n=2 Tax=Paenibacillus solanacearum TaxID=2048548 RepID=A0A916K7U3_9BACL|nr:hypothetical protein PAESOLCIP111_04446 [Paenibacillus solanacearum]
MEQAAEALRLQGAVDIQLDYENDYGASAGLPPQPSNAANNEPDSETGCTMTVVVESSRLSLAYDLIAQFGGSVT